MWASLCGNYEGSFGQALGNLRRMIEVRRWNAQQIDRLFFQTMPIRGEKPAPQSDGIVRSKIFFGWMQHPLFCSHRSLPLGKNVVLFCRCHSWVLCAFAGRIAFNLDRRKAENQGFSTGSRSECEPVFVRILCRFKLRDEVWWLHM